MVPREFPPLAVELLKSKFKIEDFEQRPGNHVHFK
jgi:hypothetical protein